MLLSVGSHIRNSANTQSAMFIAIGLLFIARPQAGVPQERDPERPEKAREGPRRGNPLEEARGGPRKVLNKSNQTLRNLNKTFGGGQRRRPQGGPRRSEESRPPGRSQVALARRRADRAATEVSGEDARGAGSVRTAQQVSTSS